MGETQSVFSTGLIETGIPGRIRAKVFTYFDLIDYHAKSNVQALSQEHLINSKASLNGFLKSCGVMPHAAIGAEFGEGFNVCLDKFLAERAVNSAASNPNVKSQVRAYKRDWDALCKTLGEIPPTFTSLHEAVDFYVRQTLTKEPDLSANKLAKEVGLNSSGLHTLRTVATYALHNKKADYEALERCLGAPPGTLTHFVALASDSGLRPHSAFGERVAKLMGRDDYEYYFRPAEVRSPLLHSELIDFCAFKLPTDTTTMFSERKLKRRGIWRLRPIADYQVDEWKLPYTTASGGTMVAPTGAVMMNNIAAYFGALYSLDPVKYAPAKYSLAWMCDSSLMQIVVNFLTKRLSYNTFVEMVVKCGKTFAGAEHGFVAQQPAVFENRLFAPLPPGQGWSEWIASQHDRLLSGLHVVAEGGKAKFSTRNAKEPIQRYLDWEAPTLVFDMLINKMNEELSNPQLRRMGRLALRRDITLVRMLSEQPLRAFIYGNLTGGLVTDEKGNVTSENSNHGQLYRKYQPDGSYLWAIRLTADDFKNWRTAQKKKYDVCFSRETTEEIDIYLREVRVHFPFNAGRVFTSWSCIKRKNVEPENQVEEKYARTKYLEAKISERTLLLGGPAFGMHAWRHLIATEIIRNVEGGYQKAAEVLHDEPKTVMDAYSDVQAKHGSSKWIERLEAVRALGRGLNGSNGSIDSTIETLARNRGISYKAAAAELENFLNGGRSAAIEG